MKPRKKTTLPKRIVFSIITLVISLSVLLLAAEVMIRVIQSIAANRSVKGSETFFVYDRDFAFFVPDKDMGVWMGDTDNTRPHINSFGMYDVERELKTEDSMFRIAVLGDSFMHGVHAGLGFRMSDIMEEKLGDDVEVLNFGVSSVGTVHESVVYTSKVRPFKPDLVIIGFLTGNDIRDNSRALSSIYGYTIFAKDGPYCIRNPEGGFQYVPARVGQGTNYLSYKLRRCSRLYAWGRSSLIPWVLSKAKRNTVSPYQEESSSPTNEIWSKSVDPFWLDLGVYAPPPDPLWKDAWAFTEHALLKLKKDVSADQGQLLVVLLTDELQITPDPLEYIPIDKELLPRGFDVDYPNTRIQEFCKSNDIAVLNFLPVFREYRDQNKLEWPYFSFDNDGHWRRLGHRLAANAVVEYIKENSLISAADR